MLVVANCQRARSLVIGWTLRRRPAGVALRVVSRDARRIGNRVGWLVRVVPAPRDAPEGDRGVYAAASAGRRSWSWAGCRWTNPISRRSHPATVVNTQAYSCTCFRSGSGTPPDRGNPPESAHDNVPGVGTIDELLANNRGFAESMP